MEFSKECASRGVDYEQMLMHQSRIKNAVEQNIVPQFKIIDTCTPSNAAILPSDFVPSDFEGGSTIGTFVPAAGAASRYFEVFSDLLSAAKAGDRPQIASALEALRAQGAENWPLPSTIRSVLAEIANIQSLTDQLISDMVEQIELPKALQPCVCDGDSFLALKQTEYRNQNSLSGEAYIIRPEHESVFRSEVDEETQLLFQGPALSTVRFNDAFEPVMEDGRLSIVPAGHGSLAALLPSVKSAKSVLIKNIDNVIGTNAGAIEATDALIRTHQYLLSTLDDLRRLAKELAWEQAAQVAVSTLSTLPPQDFASNVAGCASQSKVWELVSRLFYLTPDQECTEQKLVEVLHRPLNTMGMVPNSGTDVGGTPCFVEVSGVRKRVCLEVPHASSADKKHWLEDPAKSTHFNPVFVCAEIPQETDYYTSRSEDFWLLAKKNYRGERVYYHELALYELLSHCDLANAVFVEIPRLLFNPHKSLKDASGRVSSDWK